ncbi:MAG: SPOR domain-containing protein [Balneolaceae bacterium]
MTVNEKHGIFANPMNGMNFLHTGFMRQPSLLMLFLLFILSSCATSEPATDHDSEQNDEPLYAMPEGGGEDSINLERLSDQERRLYTTRSRLTDQFAAFTHDMPESFLQEVEEEEVDIFAGYRIQLLSTRDMAIADSTQSNFNAWADSTFQEYAPHAYIHFRQPYYRVRAGDFHSQERAVEFSRILKSDYPDAWVVHDRINPVRVPADTVSFNARR